MTSPATRLANAEGWDWFDDIVPDLDEAERDDLARSFARCFSGGDGSLVLDHLKATVLDRRLGPNASDAALRFLEGQRTLAAHILSMVERGRG